MASRVPPEILVSIASFIVDPTTLFALRSVNHVWSFAATIQLRNVAYISMERGTHHRLETQIQDEKSRNAICSLIMNVPDRDYWTVRGPNDRVLSTHVSFIAHRSLSTIIETWIPRFPNLEHISLHFRPPSRDLAPFGSSTKFKSIFLCYLMRSLFHSLSGLKSLAELSLHSLPIQANFPIIGPPDSFAQTRVITTIQSLELKRLKLAFVGVNVWPPFNPNHGFNTSLLGYQSFDPPGVWIHHAKDTLRHLSLTCWAFYMRDIPNACDCIEHRIPHLESLELGGIGFTSDTQLKWILNHYESLCSLVLEDCAIVYSIEIQSNYMSMESTSTSRIVERNGRQHHVYYTRWDHWFEQFQTQLHKLTNFQFGSRRVRAPGEEGPEFVSESSSGPPFEKPAKFLFGLFPDRYIAMADGEDYCPWILRPPTWNHAPPPRIFRHDQRALRNLMQKIGQDFRESDTSDHAAFVVDLTGYVRPVGEEEEEQTGNNDQMQLEPSAMDVANDVENSSCWLRGE